LPAGLIFDEAGKKLVSSHATKNGRRYRYYITSDGAGRTAPGSDAAKVRVSATQIDDLVLSTLSRFLNDKQQIAKFFRKQRSRTVDLESALEVASHLADVLVSDSQSRKQELVSSLVSRVTVAEAAISLSLKAKQLRALLSNTAEPPERHASVPDIVLEAQFNAPSRDKATKLLIEQPGGLPSGPDPVVVKAIARAHGWFEQLITGKADSMAQIAVRESITDNYVSNLIHLAWLSPHQVDLILEGDPEATRLVKKFEAHSQDRYHMVYSRAPRNSPGSGLSRWFGPFRPLVATKADVSCAPEEIRVCFK